MKAKILKALVYDGKKLFPGNIVNVSEWRNRKTLISGRYIEILDEQTEEPKPKAEEIKPLVEESTPAKPKTTAKIKDTK